MQSGQDLSEEEDVAHLDLVRDAKVKGLGASQSFKVLKLLRAGDVRVTAVGTRWAPTSEMVEGVETAQARIAA